ncbi:hypothetical protein A3736_03445 [Erythrobacter sp. HI0063]|jgi:hypothetical protein|uniref:DUF3147 family protein n=1 Tax=Erythrobacter sp. HI0063 TaxID=1822240 RepID=UPI0007C2125A|nr:DUF3147 family protein [Erythrobacter sp. HI0063]KZY58412.1 hypothetical protein A3736_03445 [Erythrobacter sp. HI0063]
MGYFLLKAALSGIIIAIVSEVARRAPGLGALIASLPLISVLGMIWLWRDTEDTARMAEHAFATFWFVLPSLPMFLAIPVMLGRGVTFWPALAIGCAMTVLLYLAMVWALGQFGVRL